MTQERGMPPTGISRKQVKTVARVAALHNGTSWTCSSVIQELFRDMAEHFDWYPSGTIPALTAEARDAIQLEKEVQLDRIRAFFDIDNCGY
tara:strand:+ start:517 stop:789 length:273 start_codon:yes stop_codon:yes gene_type:complete